MGTRVSEESWFGRIGKALMGIIVGGLLTIVSVPLLFWNEGRAVRTAKGLKEGANVVIDVKPDSIEPANEGLFVHLSGQTSTSDLLHDDPFAIQYNGIRLTRHVEMYQWTEAEETKTKKKLGGGTTTTKTFTYDKEWQAGLVDSSRFDEAQAHQNPAEIPFAQQSSQAKNVSIGQFRLPDSLVSMISGQEPLAIDKSNLPQGYENRATIRNDGPGGSPRIYIAAGRHSDDAHRQQNLIDLQPTQSLDDSGGDLPDSDLPNSETETEPAANENSIAAPEIGDVRVWFTATATQPVSLLSRQRGDSFEPFQTHYGTQIHQLTVGVVSAAEMIAQAEASNRFLTWVLRFVGTLLMFFGTMLVLRPLVVLADVLPLAGSLVGFGTALAAGLLTIAGSMTVIGVAWIFYRPLLGISLLAIAAIAIGMIIRRGRNQRGRQPEMLTQADLV